MCCNVFAIFLYIVCMCAGRSRMSHRTAKWRPVNTCSSKKSRKLNSLAEPRFNNSCTHHEFGNPAPKDTTTSEECCKDDCEGESKHHCMHCSTSFCAQHLADHLCSAEYLPASTTEFVCRECSPNVESHRHTAEGCASCEEIEFFKKDVMKVVRATGVPDIIGRADTLVHAIDIMVGHAARTANQERYWPDMLDKM